MYPNWFLSGCKVTDVDDIYLSYDCTFFRPSSKSLLPANKSKHLFFSGVLRELCDRPNFSELSDLEDLSDDEVTDPTYLQPRPRINIFDMALGAADIIGDENEPMDEDEPVEENQPDIVAENQPANFVVNPRSVVADWEYQDIFDPIPAAPPIEQTHPDLDYVSTIDSFKTFVPDTLIEDIASATSNFIRFGNGREIFLGRQDIEKFIGVSIMMSYLRYPRIRMYWAARTRVPDIANTMTRDKYFLIRSHFRVRDYTLVTPEEKKNKYW